MRQGFAWLLLVAVVAGGCSRDDTRNTAIDTADSIKLMIAKHKALERAIHDYYSSIEEDIKNDLGVTAVEIVDRVQLLIDDGFVQKPVILVITESGARWASVDYRTYKEYMTSNAIDVRRYYGKQPDILDSASMDSIRNNLLKALK